MKKLTLFVVLVAGLACLLNVNAAAAGGRSFAEAAGPANPDKADQAPDPVGPAPIRPPYEGPTVVTIFTDRAVFQAAFPGLPMEDFEEGNAPPGGFSVCDAPLDAGGDAACGFDPGDILAGVAFQDNPGPELGALILLGAGTSLNPSQALVANTFTDSFDILFDPPVTAAGMDLHSTSAPGSGGPDIISIQIFDAGGVLIGSDPAAAASGPGNFWGVSSDTPIGRISLLSTNSWAEGVDNIEFSAQAALTGSAVAFVDSCSSNPANVNGVFEPGETISIEVELTAVAGAFTGITGVLSSATPGVTIVTGNASWPDLAAGASAFSVAPFVIQLDPAIACGSTVDLTVTVTATEGGPFAVLVSELIGQPLEPDVPLAIPDNSPAGIESALVVADDVTLTDVNVRVQIDHTWVGDLYITLRAPDNTEVVLLDRPGVPASSTVGCSDNNMDITFDDDSAFDPEDYCTASTPWYVGTANPVGSLATFNGMSSAGTWRLFVTDNAGSDTGTIVNWELITTPAIAGVCTVCVPVQGDADLQIVKSTAVGTVLPGTQVVYTLTVTNNGPGAATAVVVTDDLPAGLTFVSSDCGGVFAAPTFTWAVGDLAAAASAVCNLTVAVDAGAAGATIVNVATVTSATNDPVPGNSASAATIFVQGISGIPTLDRIGLVVLLIALCTAAVVMLRRRPV